MQPALASTPSRSPLQEISNVNRAGVVTTPTQKLSKNKQVSPISKYLEVPNASKIKLSAQTCAITGARVLTSAECLARIREKELKKQEEEKEKENKRKIREEKKKQCEEEKLKKAKEKRKKITREDQESC